MLIAGDVGWSVQRPTGDGPEAAERCSEGPRRGAKFGHVDAPGEAYSMVIWCLSCNIKSKDCDNRDWVQHFHAEVPVLSQEEKCAKSARLKSKGWPGWPYECY